MSIDYPKAIEQARVYDVASRTPLSQATGLSRRLGNTVLLKREDLQPVFSFKLRGAYNRLAALSEEERKRGVIAASAGNHAQGVALAARRMGISALIVMPKTTPSIKVDSVRELGAETDLHGNAYDDAYGHARELARSGGRVLVHPYDDPLVIAGQGTVGMEILEQHPQPIHTIFVPVGGGGLVAGVAAWVKANRPEVRVVGVEPEDSNCLYAALKANKRVVLEQVGLFADGVAVRQIGEHPFEVARDYVDDVVLVSTDEICAAIKDIYDDTRSIAEPAGALALAGLKRYVETSGVEDEVLVAINSGANVNFDRLRNIAERAGLGEQSEVLLAVTIPERPGSFHEFCHTIGHRAITEFNYRYATSGAAHVFVGVQTRAGEADRERLIGQLREREYPVVDISDDEVAKQHIRYMVGGRAPEAEHERLFRVEFPERPGALLRFLNRMGSRWNISLFHYRSHGDAFGRVLLALQVPSRDEIEFHEFLDTLGYAFTEETDNPVYRLFLV